MDFRLEIAKELAKLTEVDINEIYNAIEIPPDTAMGDYAFPCFRLAKAMRKAPAAIAPELAEKLHAEYVERAVAQGPYLNVFVNKESFAQAVMTELVEQGEKFGSSTIGNGKTIVFDYSSPNIAKPFHVGHLRSTGLGNALYQIYSFLGYDCFGINYLGDWGTQFGKVIVAYKKWGDREAVERDDVKELNRLYVMFHEEAEKDPSLEDEARAWLLKMQEGDEEALALWRWFKDVSMLEYERIYKRLGVTFDSYNGESFYNDKMDAVVDALREKKLLAESDGAMVVDLEEYKMPPCLILRRDGGTLYPTRDIASAMYRKSEYNFHKALYLTAVDQNLHFAQWFKVVELMGYEWAKDLIHVPFGMVKLPQGKMATRKGNVVYMEDLLDEAVSRIRDIIAEKNPDLENKDEVAEQVGIGAILFNDMYNSRIKDVIFSWDKMLNFEGETGPYVQYTHARCCGILSNAGEFDYTHANYNLLGDDASFALLKELYSYPGRLIEAADKNEPFIVSRALVAICQAFNRFYTVNHILGSEENVKAARLALVKCVKTILKSGLGLLGIAAPVKM